jgi:hypothetical protein
MADEDLKKKFSDYVVEESRKGNVVFAALDDYVIAPLDEFIQQPAEGILYDLNRLPEVVLTFIEDRKWVNDFAAQMVIKRLRDLMPEWRSVGASEPPIRSQENPKPYVLAVDAKRRMSVGYVFDKYSEGGLWWVFAKPIGTPTHWMPLPDPPETK